MQEPVEVGDRQDEQAVARVAAVDVAKASGVVCTRVPRAGEPGRFITKVWRVGATTNAILELADHLTALDADVVAGRLQVIASCGFALLASSWAVAVPQGWRCTAPARTIRDVGTLRLQPLSRRDGWPWRVRAGSGSYR